MEEKKSSDYTDETDKKCAIDDLMMDPEEQIAIFNSLSRNFRNVYLANINDGTAKILKVATDYDLQEVVNLKNKVFPYEGIVNTWIAQRVHPDDREWLMKALSVENLREVFSKEDEYVGNYRSVDGGEMHNYQFNISKVDDFGTVVAGFQIIDSIIEEHLAYEKKRKEREEVHKKELEKSYRELSQMRDIFAASKMGTWYIKFVEGQAPTMKADDRMKELIGVSGKDLSPEETYDAWFSNIESDALQSVLNSVEKMKQGNKDENTYLWNHPVLGKRYVRCGGTAYQVPGGYVLRRYHYDVDDMIRRQKEQEKILADTKAAEKQHAEVVSSLATIYTTIFIASLETYTYEVINSVHSMEKLTGMKGSFFDVEEDILDVFIAPDMKDEMREFLDLTTMVKRLENVNTIATEYRNPEGRWLQSRFIVKSRDEFGKAKEVLYVARDFTEEKQYEMRQENALRDALLAAKQANRAKTSFLNNMSHDIRTPMNAIIGFTALAQTHIGNTSMVQDYLGKIHTSSAHLLNLINEILDMSRIESGVVKLEENIVHIPDVLKDLRIMIHGQIESRRQNLYIDALDVKNEDVITDKLRLNQILLNIVSNAIKYTGVGGNIIIRVTERASSMKGYTTYEFSIKDNGMGMTPEFMEHVFDTFSREQSSTVSGIQGTGLGMSITKNIVDMMNGNITVESELGRGSEFVVTVDFKIAEHAAVSEPIADLKGARALVVDDDINTCQSVSKMLRDIEMRPDWSTSGREAVIRAKEAEEIKDEYKVYIIDYLMPDMNGIETVRQIRRYVGDEIPIIVLTAYDWSDVEDEAKEAGVTAFVSKPIFMSELRTVLTRSDINNSANAAERVADYSGKRVLLVEDNELNYEIAAAILREFKLEVDHASDGIEAVNFMIKADDDRYDMIFMDVQMPKMDGYTATREIRTMQNNRKANIPIIAMTANAFDEDRQKSFEAGMNGHISKPIDMDTIAGTLKKVFKNIY